MKELLEDYCSYNLWANERLINYSLKLDKTLWNQKVPSSFQTLAQTFFHLWQSEFVWWQRIKLIERVEFPEQGEMEFPVIASNLLSQSAIWKEWVMRSSEASLLHEFAYYNSKKEFFKSPVWKVIMHNGNHGTYHRGQAVNIFHQIDQNSIPATDFILFTRKYKK